MSLLSLFIVSIVPGIFWVWYFHKQDYLDPEPWSLVIKSFVAGALSVLPVMLIEQTFSRYLSISRSPLVALFAIIVIVGLTEEFFKFFAAYASVYRNKEFNEIMDGIIYVVTAGLGFATTENLLYASAYGLKVGATRAIVTSLAHAGFSGIVGFYFGLARCRPERRHSYIATGLVIGSVLHGLYDYFIMSGMFNFTLTVATVLAMQIYLARLIKKAEILSPFR